MAKCHFCPSHYEYTFGRASGVEFDQIIFCNNCYDHFIGVYPYTNEFLNKNSCHFCNDRVSDKLYLFLSKKVKAGVVRFCEECSVETFFELRSRRSR